MKNEKFIKVGVLYNAFDPSQIEYSEVLYRKNTSLKTYLRDLPTDCEWKIGLNGIPVTIEEHGKTRLKPTDTLQLVVVPRGGGAKGILRMVAMVAVVVGAALLFAPGGALAGSWLFGSTAATMALSMSVFTLAGGLLINALLPPKPPKVDNEDSNSYGYDGAKNTARQGVALPVVYGQFRVAGNYVDMFTENLGDDQYLYGRTVLSDGEIDNVTNPLLNDQPIENYSNIEWGWRAGTSTEDVNPLFNRNIAQINKNIKLPGAVNSTWVTHVTTDPIDKFQLTFLFPKGLVHITEKKGKKNTRGSTVSIQYRKQGDSTWTSWPYANVGADGVLFVDRRLKSLRRTIESPLLPVGIYEIRVRRSDTEGDQEHDIDETYLGEVGQITTSATNMRHVANGFYKIKMNEQLNGVPNISWLVRGVKVNKYDINGNVTERVWSDNPAWIVLDMLIGPERGTPGIFGVDYPAFVEWAEWCELQGLKFNGVFDTTTSLWDACVDVLKVGHAAFTRIGTKLSLAIDKPQQPVMLFGPGNIHQGSFNINYVAMNDRANEFELSYYDKEDNNVQKTIRVVDPDADRRGDIPRAVSFSVPGIDNFEQAEKEIWYQLYNNRYIRRTVTFDAPVESIGLSIGDVALVQHDIVNWGTSGRVENATTTEIILDKPVDIEEGVQYSLLVIHNYLNRATGTVAGKTGNVVTVNNLSSPVDFTNVKRLVQGSIDRQIIAVNTSGTTCYVTIDGENDFANGSVLFVDTDVIEERDVFPTLGESNTVSVAVPFTVPPLKYSNYMFGDKSIAKKPYRLKALSGSGYDKRTLTFIEYNEDIYNPPEMLQPLPPTTMPKIVNHVSDLAFVIDQFATYDTTVVNGVLSWNAKNIKNYGGADIYISINDASFSFYKTVFNATEAQIMLQSDTNVVFKVVAFNDTLTRASQATAPTYAFDVKATPSGVDAPTGLEVVQLSYIATALVLASWNAPTGLTALEAERIRYRVQVKPDGEEMWDEYGVTDQLNIRIGDLRLGTHIVRVRSEIGSSYSDWAEDAIATFTTTETLTNGNGEDDIVPPAAPTNLVVNSQVTDLGAKLSATWTPPVDSDVAGYVVAVAEGEGTFIEYMTTTPSHSIDGLNRNSIYKVKVKAYDKSSNYSNFTTVVQHTTTRDTVPPSPPTALNAEVSLKAAFLRWTNPYESDLAKIDVYENTTNNSATAAYYASVNALPGGNGGYTRTGLSAGNRWFFLRAVDSSGNASAFSSGLQVTIPSLSETDFTPTASGIAPVIIIPNGGSLPTTGNYEGRAATFNGKLYRYTSGAWKASIASSDIDGKLIAGQIAASAIRTEELAAGAVTASKLAIRGENLWPDSQSQDINWWKGLSQGTFTSENGYVLPANDSNAFNIGWHLVPDAGTLGGRVGGSKGYWQLWSGNSNNGFISTGIAQIIPPSLMAKPTTTYELGVGCTNGSNRNMTVNVQYFDSAGAFINAQNLIDWSAGDQTTIYYRAKFKTPNNCATIRIYFESPAGPAFSGFINVGNITLREAASGTMIVDGSITAAHITTAKLNADDILVSGSLSADKIKSNTSLPASLKIGSTGFDLGTVVNSSALATLNSYNGDFSLWADETAGTATPKGFVHWGMPNGKTKVATDNGKSGVRIIVGAGSNNGLLQTGDGATHPANWELYNDKWIVIEAEVKLNSGNLRASGILIRATNGSDTTLNFATDPEIGGNIVGDGVGGGSRYVYKKLVRCNPGSNPRQEMFLMNHWDGLGDINQSGNDITWIRAGWRYANEAEINPAKQINANTTTIDPGKILISGGTTLASWRGGGDNTKINGGAIEANSIKANQLTIGNRGINFTDLNFRASGNTVFWDGGAVYFINDAGVLQGIGLTGGQATFNGTTVWVWWNKGSGILNHGTTWFNNPDDVLVAVYFGGNNINANYGRTLIHGDFVQTGTVHANRIIGGTITANELSTGQLITTSAQIGDAVISNAKIGNLQVDTIKIANNAVTVLNYAYTAAEGSNMVVGGGRPQIQAVAIGTSGGPVQIQFATGLKWISNSGGAGFGSSVVLSVLRNGAEIFGGPQVYATQYEKGYASGVFIDTPGPGTHTYTLVGEEFVVGTTSRANLRFISALELKK